MPKITYLSTLLLLLIIFSAKAQDFKSGLRLGVNAAQINGDGMSGFNKLGGVAGLFVKYDVSERVSWQFEMLYSGKGSKQVVDPEFGPNPNRLWNNLRLHYIEVPVMAHFNIWPKVSVQAGLGGAYLFGTNYEPRGGSSINPDFMKKYEVFVTGGAAYQFTPKISGFARYTNSLLSIGRGGNGIGMFGQYNTMVSLVASFGINYHFVPENIIAKKPKFLE